MCRCRPVLVASSACNVSETTYWATSGASGLPRISLGSPFCCKTQLYKQVLTPKLNGIDNLYCENTSKAVVLYRCAAHACSDALVTVNQQYETRCTLQTLIYTLQKAMLVQVRLLLTLEATSKLVHTLHI